MVIYGTFVKFIAGFYMGCVGTVLGINSNNIDGKYEVTTYCKIQGSSTATRIYVSSDSKYFTPISTEEYNQFFEKN